MVWRPQQIANQVKGQPGAKPATTGLGSKQPTEHPFPRLFPVDGTNIAAWAPDRAGRGSAKKQHRKGGSPVTEDLPGPDRLATWIAHYQRHAVAGVRAPLVAAKIALHLGRFQAYFA